MRILLIEAEKDEKLYAALRRSKISFDSQTPGERQSLPENIYDVIVWCTPALDADMLSRIAQLRAESIDTPLLVITENAGARARIRALDAGADNILVEPCLKSEVTAHIRALSRRVPQMQREVITAGDLTLDRGKCVLRSRGGETHVSCKELQLAELLLRHPGQVLPREVLHQKVWGVDREAAYNNIEVYLSLMRKKLREIGSHARIQAENGIGYSILTE